MHSQDHICIYPEACCDYFCTSSAVQILQSSTDGKAVTCLLSVDYNEQDVLKMSLLWEEDTCLVQDFGFDKQGVGISREGPVNALPTGRKRATKEATAYSKATVQPRSHTKHSNVLCKGWAGR